MRMHLGTKLPPLAAGVGAVFSGLGASGGLASLRGASVRWPLGRHLSAGASAGGARSASGAAAAAAAAGAVSCVRRIGGA